jgi:MerR family transcriptional regulator, light-induced transcriptional regulator
MPSSLAQGPILTGLNTSKTDKNDVDEPLYTVRVVAERVGVPTATLRSWNQRYGVGPPEHSPGRHRLYSENDIAVVRRATFRVPPPSR